MQCLLKLEREGSAGYSSSHVFEWLVRPSMQPVIATGSCSEKSSSIPWSRNSQTG